VAYIAQVKPQAPPGQRNVHIAASEQVNWHPVPSHVSSQVAPVGHGMQLPVHMKDASTPPPPLLPPLPPPLLDADPPLDEPLPELE
jgi:hypothetical protein